MPQSLVKNYIHIIFSTKYREPLIDHEIEEELYKYLGGICKNLECFPVMINGYRDHVHILCLLSRKIALMKLIEELKSHSSKWIKTKGERYGNFYWQKGYGCFSVRPTDIDIVERYIANQESHHKKKNFKSEYLGMLKEFDVTYDEKYLWD